VNAVAHLHEPSLLLLRGGSRQSVHDAHPFVVVRVATHPRSVPVIADQMRERGELPPVIPSSRIRRIRHDEHEGAAGTEHAEMVAYRAERVLAVLQKVTRDDEIL